MENHNITIEQHIISILLNNNEAFDEVSHIIKKDMFFVDTHKIIFESIQKMLINGKRADILTVMHALSANEQQSTYIGDIIKIQPPSSAITQYVEMLMELSSKRKLSMMLVDLQKNITDNKPVEQCWEYIEQCIIKNNFTSTSNVVDFKQMTDNIISDIDFTMKNPKSIVGLTTGFNKLDEITGGFQPGELIILAGRPSVGKTAMAINIGVACAKSKENGGGVLFISLEMTPLQIGKRILASLTSIPLENFTHGHMNKDNFRYLINIVPGLQNLPLYIYDSFVLNIPKLRSLLRQYKRTNNIQMVVLDYLQLVTSTDKYASREQEVSDISRSLKLLAKEIGIPILALSQMSRDIEKRQSSATNSPKLSDLRSSGAIEQDADKIIFLYRHVQDDIEDRKKIICTIAKNRNGALGEILLNYNGDTTTFTEFNTILHRSF